MSGGPVVDFTVAADFTVQQLTDAATAHPRVRNCSCFVNSKYLTNYSVWIFAFGFSTWLSGKYSCVLDAFSHELVVFC